ncbi:MAG TPA: class I SAM-dependent methyltransferase [Tepidisphaeraceae bacterium]|nr:class I SAM-dependent methyltransferase [Tepidisphaeraceae bacterium]
MAYVYEDRVRDEILRMIPSDGHIIGSVGCGTGATEAVLVQQGRQVHGVDISAEAVERAKPRLTSARVVAADDRAPFSENSLDGLILADIIEHMPRAWDALASYTQAVRPGGWVVISVPNMRNLKVLHQFIFGGDWPEDPTGIFDATHVQVMTRRRLERWCEQAGLHIEQWYDLYLSNRWKTKLLRALDYLTLKQLHDWWQMELQVRTRRKET